MLLNWHKKAQIISYNILADFLALNKKHPNKLIFKEYAVGASRASGRLHRLAGGGCGGAGRLWLRDPASDVGRGLKVGVQQVEVAARRSVSRGSRRASAGRSRVAAHPAQPSLNLAAAISA